MTDIVESLCKATDILVEKQLESLSFDITIEATVTDTTNADDGRYIVSDGNTLFEAYSSAETKYNKNDVVLVTIPQGNYDKQKIIIGKQANNTESAKTYISPFEEFINISNNLISGEHYIAMQANSGVDDKYTWDINTPNFSNSAAFQYIKKIIKDKETLENKKRTNVITEEYYNQQLKKLNDDYNNSCLIWNSETDYQGNLFESKYTKLGIKLQVSTWLNEYDVVEGNFGLMIVLMVQSNDGKQSFPIFIPFDSKDFFGNVYNFETYYSQEILVDISEYINYPINQILIFAYQRNNFKDINGDLIVPNTNDSGFFGSSLPENIFMKDLYLCLGTAKGEFEQDSLTIITSSGSEYTSNLDQFEYTHELYQKKADGIISEEEYYTQVANIEESLGLKDAPIQLKRLYNNKKVLGLRWVHKDPETNEIKCIAPNEIPSGYQIYWYRYKLGAPSPDNFAGPHWERFYGAKNVNINTFLLNDEEEYNLTEQEVHSTEPNHADDIATNMLDNVIFYPNVNKQVEQIKAIIVKEEEVLEGFSDSAGDPFHFVCSSEIEEFRNKKEVTNIATFIDVNALNIRFNDSEKGNYFLYNRAGNISTEKDKELKTLTAVFDDSGEKSDIYDKSELMTPYSYIKWSFPASSSMIIPATSKNENAVKLTKENLDTASSEYSANVSYNLNNDTYDFVFQRSDNATTQDSQISLLTSVGYFINSRLDRNATRNIVYLEVMKDGQLYTASVKMNFGTAGTSGSDYTLAIVWDNNENAFDINKGELCGQVCLYNQNGELVELEDESEYSISWYKVRALDAESSLYDENKEYKVNDIVYYDGEYYKCKEVLNNIGNLPIDTNYWESTNPRREFSPKVETRNLYYPINSDVIEPLRVSNSEETTKIFKTSYTDKIKTEEPQNNIVSYLASPPLDDEKTYEIAYFDVVKKEFVKEYEEDGNKKNITYDKNCLQYRKLIDNEKTGILTFKAFDEVDLSDTNSGNIEYKDRKMIYHYSSLNRAFIKYNDMYIIDPWDEYISTETYYYPIYDSKKSYNSEKNLQIQSVSASDIPITKGRFKIKKDENSIVHIETDLYILEVALTHFGDYDLIARFPIPLKNSDPSHNNDSEFKSYIVDYIEGPTDVRYSTSGENDYNKNPYQITLRYLSKHPIKIYRQATETYIDEMNNLLDENNPYDTDASEEDKKKFKKDLSNIKQKYQSAIYSTSYINSLYTQSLEEIEKSRYNSLMSAHFNMEEILDFENLDPREIFGGELHLAYLDNAETCEKEYQTLRSHLEKLDNFSLIDDTKKNIMDLTKEDIDKNLFITYQQKKQGYNETENNANEIIGHWELVYEPSEKTNDFTFLVESNEINIVDTANSQLYGIKENKDEDNITYTIYSSSYPEDENIDENDLEDNNPYYPGSLYWMKKKFDIIEENLENTQQSLENTQTEIQSSYQRLKQAIEEEYNKRISNINNKIKEKRKDIDTAEEDFRQIVQQGIYNDNYLNQEWKKVEKLIEKRIKTINSLEEKRAMAFDEKERKKSELDRRYSELSQKISEQLINERINQLEFQLATAEERERINKEIRRLEALKEERYFIKPLLYPSNVYFEDDPLYGIKFVLDKDILSDLDSEFAENKQGYEKNPGTDQYVVIPRGTVLWSQPIYVYQDNYPSTTLNKWNGKDIVTDNDTGIISARGFSAGKKEIDNTFTGVVLGDWSKTDSDAMLTQQTGVYGFNHGRMSYALKDDGTAFFGKDGKGRIYFDGNKAQIYSAQWVNSIPINSGITGKYTQSKLGMMIDIDDGELLINGTDDRKISISSKGMQFSCKKSQREGNITLLRLDLNQNNEDEHSNINYFFQSADFQDVFSQSLGEGQGSLIRPGSGFKIDLADGNIKAFDLKMQIGEVVKYGATQHVCYFFELDTKKDDLLKINNGTFKVTKAGDVKCQSLTVEKPLIVKSSTKGGTKWDKSKINNPIRITKEGNLTTKGSTTIWGNLIVKSNTTNSGKIKNNIRLTKKGNLTVRNNITAWGNLVIKGSTKQKKLYYCMPDTIQIKVDGKKKTYSQNTYYEVKPIKYGERVILALANVKPK